jgi:hypothetical protein
MSNITIVHAIKEGVVGITTILVVVEDVDIPIIHVVDIKTKVLAVAINTITITVVKILHITVHPMDTFTIRGLL